MLKERCTAIVLAAGQGKRMNTAVKKQFLTIEDKPVIYYSLDCFQKASFIQDIILVTGADSVQYCRTEIVERYGFDKVTGIVTGGKERYDSVYEGLINCKADTQYVYIHDGARPFIDSQMLERALSAVKEHKACAVGMPSKDTVKIINQEQIVCNTPDRSTVWSIQTPQVFAYDMILGAHEEMRSKDMNGITDDAMIVERLGKYQVKMVEGSYENIKITTPEDLYVAEAFLQARKEKKKSK